MTVIYHRDLVQGSEEWMELRRGVLTASEMRLLVTPATLKAASNAYERAHIYELAAQRVSGFVEPAYISDDMLRGQEDEIDARDLYRQHYADTEECGFITNDRWGFEIGYSPDGLVGDDGLIEIKSRRQKYQVETIAAGKVPPEHVVQVQTGLMVAEREWCDFISYSAGLPMFVVRVHAVPEIQDAIIEIASAAEKRIAEAVDAFHAAVKRGGFLPTERRVERDILI